MEKEYKFKAEELESQIATLSQKGITELSVTDEKTSRDKNKLIRLIKLISKHAPDVFVSFLTDASVIDRELVAAAQEIFCSFDIPLEGTNKGGKLLFDKKFYANKARLLNEAGLVFGFQLSYAVLPGDSLKLFMERLDFAVQQYPNHIDFPQTMNSEMEKTASVTGFFSAKDIRYARDLSFACRSFYSSGRAVPWFLSVLKPLRIYPSRFFADFAEWQLCNNCDYKSGYVPENENHKALEKMQLLFLDEKYEEKSQHALLPLIHDVVLLNGAMSRAAGEGEEENLKTSYNPEDLLSVEALDLESFCENVCMEECKLHIFLGPQGPDFEIIG